DENASEVRAKRSEPQHDQVPIAQNLAKLTSGKPELNILSVFRDEGNYQESCEQSEAPAEHEGRPPACDCCEENPSEEAEQAPDIECGIDEPDASAGFSSEKSSHDHYRGCEYQRHSGSHAHTGRCD